MPKVHLLAGNRRQTLAQAIFDLVTPEISEKIRSAKKILIKPEVGHHRRQLAVVSVDTLRGLIAGARALTQAPIIVAEGGHYNTQSAFAEFGYQQLTKEFPNVTLLDLNRERAEGPLERPYVGEDAFTVAVGLLKTDRVLGAKLSLASWCEAISPAAPQVTLEGIVFSRPLEASAQGISLDSLISAAYQHAAPDLSVIDGVLGMEGDGPVFGTPIKSGIMLASSHSLAADLAACRLMGIDSVKVEHLRLIASAIDFPLDENAIDIDRELVAAVSRRYCR